MATSPAARAASIRGGAANWFGRIHFGQTGVKYGAPQKRRFCGKAIAAMKCVIPEEKGKDRW